MDGSEVHLEARMELEPSAHELAVVNADVVTDQVRGCMEVFSTRQSTLSVGNSSRV